MSEKDLFVEKLKAQLDEWNSEIDKMRAKARGATADAKLKYEQQIAHLQGRRDELKTKLGEIQRSSKDAWKELKDGAEKAWAAFREGLEKAKSRFD